MVALRSGAGGPANAGPPTLRSVRRIFPAAHVAGKMIRILSGLRRKPGRGYPFLDLSRGTGDGSPRSAACFYRKCLLSAWPRSGFGGGGAAAAAGRRSPVICLLLLEIPAVRLAAKRLRRREGRCSGRTGAPVSCLLLSEAPAVRLAAKQLRRRGLLAP